MIDRKKGDWHISIAMNCLVTAVAKSNQILLRIFAGMAPRVLMMNF